MIKPERLKKGDKVAVVSLSRGMLGEKNFIHKLDIAKKRLEEYGLEVVVMDNALKGITYLYEHPEKRAEDLMNAFKDSSIKGIINAIGGDDTIRLLPYIDFDVIRNNPKVFMGFSDTTVNHMMMYKAGLVSYYGGSLMNNWSEYVRINDYTKKALENAFFNPTETYEIESSPRCSYSHDIVWWMEENINTLRKYEDDLHGYEVIQGNGIVRGKLLGGCLDTFVYINGTSIWPSVDEWKDKIMFIETSDSDMTPSHLAEVLRGLAAQGIFDVVKAIMVGKPYVKDKYEPYKEMIAKVFKYEVKREVPIIYNVNFGHAEPIGIIPLGLECEIDFDSKRITILEPMTK